MQEYCLKKKSEYAKEYTLTHCGFMQFIRNINLL